MPALLLLYYPSIWHKIYFFPTTKIVSIRKKKFVCLFSGGICIRYFHCFIWVSDTNLMNGRFVWFFFFFEWTQQKYNSCLDNKLFVGMIKDNSKKNAFINNKFSIQWILSNFHFFDIITGTIFQNHFFFNKGWKYNIIWKAGS